MNQSNQPITYCLPNDVWEIIKEYMMMTPIMYYQSLCYKLHLQKESLETLVSLLNKHCQIDYITIPKECNHLTKPLTISKKTKQTTDTVTYYFRSF